MWDGHPFDIDESKELLRDSYGNNFSVISSLHSMIFHMKTCTLHQNKIIINEKQNNLGEESVMELNYKTKIFHMKTCHSMILHMKTCQPNCLSRLDKKNRILRFVRIYYFGITLAENGNSLTFIFLQIRVNSNRMGSNPGLRLPIIVSAYPRRVIKYHCQL